MKKKKKKSSLFGISRMRAKRKGRPCGANAQTVEGANAKKSISFLRIPSLYREGRTSKKVHAKGKKKKKGLELGKRKGRTSDLSWEHSGIKVILCRKGKNSIRSGKKYEDKQGGSFQEKAFTSRKKNNRMAKKEKIDRSAEKWSTYLRRRKT